MIEIVPYDPAWPQSYRTAELELRRALGDLIVAIEHTGSTSVPGLAAKPIIDICAAADDLARIHAEDSRLREIAYEPEAFGIPGRLLYVKRTTAGERTHHLHVVLTERWPLLKERIFAEHLRKYPADASRYASLKVRLAQSGLDPEAYTRGKTELIQQLMDAARAERGLPSEPVWED